MSNYEKISRTLIGNTQAIITSTCDDWALTRPVNAVNWFDTKSLLLYNLYNYLAARSVRLVGGRPLFKGKIVETLHGDQDDRRDVLLIVSYPSPKNFLAMLQSRYFMLISALRAMAVKRFTFGFTRLTSEAGAISDPEFRQAYLVHHYRGDDISDELAVLAVSVGVRVLYTGTVSSLVSTGSTNAPENNIPCLLDGIAVFQAASNAELDELHQSDAYQCLIQQTTASFIGRAKRLL